VASAQRCTIGNRPRHDLGELHRGGDHPETTGTLAMLAVKAVIFGWTVIVVSAFTHSLRNVELART
jgi:hypothetical protein